jgi:hypothetical protein
VLIENASCFQPVNWHALVKAVGNGAIEMSDDLARAMGIDAPLFKATRPPPRRRRWSRSSHSPRPRRRWSVRSTRSTSTP